MTYLKGIQITLYSKVKTGEDPFGSPIMEDKPILVDNVLVSPVSSDDIVNRLELSGKKAVYVLGIPKGDQNNWEDIEVEFFGRKWRTFGIPTQGIDHLIPLDWNMKVTVEAYE